MERENALQMQGGIENELILRKARRKALQDVLPIIFFLLGAVACFLFLICYALLYIPFACE